MGRRKVGILFWAMYIRLMQDPSHPLSTTAFAVYSSQVAATSTVVFKLNLLPLVPLTNLRGFCNLASASSAWGSSISVNVLIVVSLTSR
jgi:hypothetical protein